MNENDDADQRARQADAIEDLVEELRYQNAVLTELTRAVYTVAEQATTAKHPEEPPITSPNYTRLQTDIEDTAFTREEEGDR